MGNAEVCDLDAAVFQNHDVVGLDVAMDNAPGVRVLERLCDLRGKMQGFSPVEPALLLEILLERNALDELHDDVIEVIRVRHIVNAHNIRVREHRDGLRLGMEPAAELLILRELLL